MARALDAAASGGVILMLVPNRPVPPFDFSDSLPSPSFPTCTRSRMSRLDRSYQQHYLLHPRLRQNGPVLCTIVAASCYHDALLSFRTSLWVCGCCCASCVFVSLLFPFPPFSSSRIHHLDLVLYVRLDCSHRHHLLHSQLHHLILDPYSGCHVPLS